MPTELNSTGAASRQALVTDELLMVGEGTGTAGVDEMRRIIGGMGLFTNAAYSGTTFSYALADLGRIVPASNAAAKTGTIPLVATVAWPVGAQMIVRNTGAGLLTVQTTGAGILNGVAAGSFTLANGLEAVLNMTASDVWTALIAATASGSTGQVQFNNGGVLEGATNVEIVGGNLKLDTTTDPAASAGGLILYSKILAGKSLPKIIGPSGLDTVLQNGLHGNSVFLVSPSNSTTAPNVTGGALTTVATISHQKTFASANPWQATRRTRFQTSTTAGNASGARTAYGQWFRGSAAGFGGFWFRAQFGMNINLNGGQKFCGLAFASTAIAGDPSGLVNMCGMGYDAADANTGNWFFMYNDGTGVATKVDLGTDAARNTTHGYDLMMFMEPGGSELYARVTNLHTGVVVLDTSYTTDIPAVNTALTFKCEVRNGAVAAADNIELAKAYIESDY